jgi:thiol-disulfide isomerase/thioredoxin
MDATPDVTVNVTCICALWCDSCEGYREGFFELAKEFPGARFRWLDIEDNAAEVGDREVENFPTLLVERDGAELFYGPLLPHHEHLRRLLQSLEKP